MESHTFIYMKKIGTIFIPYKKFKEPKSWVYSSDSFVLKWKRWFSQMACLLMQASQLKDQPGILKYTK